MRAYEEYSTTQEICFPIIPSHWSMWKIKHLFSERIEKGFPKEQLLVASQNHGVIPKQEYGARTVEATKDLHLLKLVKKGDFVISLRSFQGGIEYAYSQGIISPAYTIMVPEGEILPSYFRLLAKSFPFIEVLKQCVTGIREGQNVDYHKLKNRQIPLPPREEQDAIVRFLDAKCAKIDDLIKLKERQIALLNEKKQLIINQAVTKGLDPNVPMKDSGVDWIGEIPEGWEVINFSRLLIEITQGWSPSTENEERQNDQWGVLSLSAVKDGEFCPDAVKPIPRTVPVNTTLALKCGDFLLTRSNTRMLVGDVCIVDIEPTKLIPSDLIYKLSLHDIIEKKFLLYFLKSNMGRMQIERSACGSSGTMPKLTHQHIKKWKIILPPLSNQNKIIAYISNRISSMNSMIKNLKKHCDILIEYRTSLISDVVTGKINILPN